MSLDDIRQVFGFYLYFINAQVDALDQILTYKPFDISLIATSDVIIIRELLNKYLNYILYK